MKKRRGDRGFFVGVIYGAVLGILGNIMVELFFQVYFPDGVDPLAGFIGFILCLCVLAYGFILSYRISKEMYEEEEEESKPSQYYENTIH